MEFWGLTPYAIRKILTARQKASRENNVSLAYLSEALHRTKKLKPLKFYLGQEKPRDQGPSMEGIMAMFGVTQSDLNQAELEARAND